MVSRDKQPENESLPDMDVGVNEITFPKEPLQHPPAEGERRYPEEQNPRTWLTDVSAGLEYRTSRDPYQAQLVFTDGRPSDEVRTFLKSQGFRWSPDTAAWVRPLQFATAAQDREIGRRVAGEVVKLVRQEKGLGSSPGQTPF